MKELLVSAIEFQVLVASGWEIPRFLKRQYEETEKRDWTLITERFWFLSKNHKVQLVG